MGEEMASGTPRPNASGAQDLLDGGEQAVAVGQHGAVELLALLFVDGARLQGFQIQADGGDRGLQLVRDGVDEGVVLLRCGGSRAPGRWCSEPRRR